MSQYIDRKEAAKSYRPKAGVNIYIYSCFYKFQTYELFTTLLQTMSPGLKRAREPYRVKNAIMGLTLGAFAVGIWAYSINAVKQDVFDDIDEEARAMSATRTPEKKSVSPEATGSKPVSPAQSVSLEGVARADPAKTQSKPQRNYLGFRWS
jgi:cytochrome c oxidase assembly factor 3, fungi type